MNKWKAFYQENKSTLWLMGITAILMAVTGIYYKQPLFRIWPLYNSLVYGLLQTRANRYCHLLGGLNSILYTIVYIMLGLYASAVYALFFSCFGQLLSFWRWSRHSYEKSTMFRRLNGKQRALYTGLFLACFAILYVVLNALGSNHQLLDNASSLLGAFTTIMTMLAFIEYTWLTLISGVVNIFLNIATMQEHPGQITYVIFSFYSIICSVKGFISVRRLYEKQLSEGR